MVAAREVTSLQWRGRIMEYLHSECATVGVPVKLDRLNELDQIAKTIRYLHAGNYIAAQRDMGR